MSNKTNDVKSSWQPILLRATYFCDSPVQVSEAAPWWEALAKTKPENINAKASTQETVVDGDFEPGILRLGIQPGRIDWIHAISNEKQEKSQELLYLGDLRTKTSQFNSLMNTWFEQSNLPSIRRLAFSTISILTTESKADSFESISGYLPSMTFGADSTDFLYQINRPRKSKNDPDLTINRVSKWSVETLQMRSFLTSTPNLEKFSERTHNFCRLELDINTSVDYKAPILKANLPIVFSEFVNLSLEICEKGDIP